VVCRELRENTCKTFGEISGRFSSVFLIIIATDVKTGMRERGEMEILKVYKKLISMYVIDENNFF